MTAPVIARFAVPGRPVSRWSSFKWPAVRTYRQYCAKVCNNAQRAMRGRRPVSGPVGVQIVYRATAKEGDLDNFTKAILDGMNKIVFDDDSQVAGLTIWWAEASGQECVEVTVTPWPGVNGGNE